MDSDEKVVARARSRITMLPATARAIAANEMKKGDVLGAARFAGVQAAKEAASYLPLSDPELVSGVAVDFVVDEDSIEVSTRVTSDTLTGARMHALSATTVATLTIYDMCKSADRTMRIGPVAVLDVPPAEAPD